MAEDTGYYFSEIQNLALGFRRLRRVGKEGLEPSRLAAHDPKLLPSVLHASHISQLSYLYRKSAVSSLDLPVFYTIFYICHMLPDRLIR